MSVRIFARQPHAGAKGSSHRASTDKTLHAGGGSSNNPRWRFWGRRFVLVSCVPLLVAASAQATTHVSRHRRKHRAAALVGAKTLGAGNTRLRAGEAEAVVSVARASGPVSAIRIYLSPPSHVAKLFVGIYSGRHGRPYRLLATGFISSAHGGSWAQIKLASVTVRRHTTWLSASGKAGRSRSETRVPRAPASGPG